MFVYSIKIHKKDGTEMLKILSKPVKPVTKEDFPLFSNSLVLPMFLDHVEISDDSRIVYAVLLDKLLKNSTKSISKTDENSETFVLFDRKILSKKARIPESELFQRMDELKRNCLLNYKCHNGGNCTAGCALYEVWVFGIAWMFVTPYLCA